jgi:hypothetical protein
VGKYPPGRGTEEGSRTVRKPDGEIGRWGDRENEIADSEPLGSSYKLEPTEALLIEKFKM